MAGASQSAPTRYSAGFEANEARAAAPMAPFVELIDTWLRADVARIPHEQHG